MASHIPVLALLMLFFGCGNHTSTVLDFDGNTYPVKQYGETMWMLENLQSKRTGSEAEIKYYFPDNDSTNLTNYGLLYDFKTACMVCPDGWKLPTKEDWEALIRLNRGFEASAYQDADYWEGKGKINESSFSARPAGYGNNGEFHNSFKSKTYFWSTTNEGEDFVWTFIVEQDKDSVRLTPQHPTYAFSVRCIRSKP